MKKVFWLFSIFLIPFSYFFIDKKVALFFKEKEFNSFFSIITHLGDAKVLIVAVILLYIFYNREKAIFLFISIVYSGIAVSLLKIIFGRSRPDLFLDENLYGFFWFKIKYDYFSFPSGHTTTAFSFFISLSFLFPKFRILFILLATLVAFSRVYLEAHFVSDVIAGAILGSLVSIWLYSRFFKNEKR